jgi:hypothetical protein
LMAYHDGELSASGSRKIEKHLSTCEECTQLYERFVRADQASATAGVPDMSGADDQYWESFTSRTLDRVEEDAATRIPVPEKQSRPFFRMEFPRLVPAMSIALVVVVSAGILLKVGGVEPVPEAPLVSEEGESSFAKASEDSGRRAKGAAREPEGESRKDDTVHFSRQESDNQDVVGPEPVEKTVVMQPTEAVPGRLTGKFASSSVESVLSKEVAGAIPQREAESAPPENVPSELNLKKMAMADEADIQPDRDVSPSPAGVVLPDGKQVVQTAYEEQLKREDSSAAREELLVEPAASGKIEAPAVPGPVIDVISRDDASSDAGGPVAGLDRGAVEEVTAEALTGKQLPPVHEQVEAAAVAPQPPVLPAEVVENVVDVPASESKEISTAAVTAQITTGESGKAETYNEEGERSVSLPSPYRAPREQLEHARRLAEVRKYWESEQILKDLISRKPPPPVLEEASVLMVDVLSNQNRIVEAQQFLDEAKLQFPSSDLVQQYRLGTPAPVQ